MFAGNPILDVRLSSFICLFSSPAEANGIRFCLFQEIKQGFKLRPTKTVDKSKPVILAEGEDADCIAPTKRPPAAAPLPTLQVDTVRDEFFFGFFPP